MAWHDSWGSLGCQSWTGLSQCYGSSMIVRIQNAFRTYVKQFKDVERPSKMILIFLDFNMIWYARVVTKELIVTNSRRKPLQPSGKPRLWCDWLFCAWRSSLRSSHAILEDVLLRSTWVLSWWRWRWWRHISILLLSFNDLCLFVIVIDSPS